jgi:hypothetical protein
MSKTNIADVPEHLERVLLRPLVENFCYNYMYQQKFDNFNIKMVEYIKELQYGRANVYFSVSGGTYTHIILRIPVHKRVVNGKTQVTIDDPIIEVINKDSPRKSIIKPKSKPSK